jgi:DNA-binding NarL/FixJ family response regulator
MGDLRILIADDHPSIREGVRAVLTKRANWEVCGEAVDGWDALEKAKSMKPDVILLDVRMPNLGGLEAMVVIKKEVPEVAVVILSQHDPEQIRPYAMQAGASAVVSKSDVERDLLPTIERVLQKQKKSANSSDEGL